LPTDRIFAKFKVASCLEPLEVAVDFELNDGIVDLPIADSNHHQPDGANQNQRHKLTSMANRKLAFANAKRADGAQND